MSGIVKPQIGAYRRHLLVCTGPRCTADGQAQALFDSLGSKFKAAGLDAGDLRVKRTRAACFAWETKCRCASFVIAWRKELSKAPSVSSPPCR